MEQQNQGGDTAARILLAAQRLFASQGFGATTLRQITAAAEVNLAAVNYHYGSKQGLIEAVSRHLAEPLCHGLQNLLQEREVAEAQAPGADELLELLVRALLQMQDRQDSALALLMRMLEQAYMPDQQALRQFLDVCCTPALQRYLTLLRQDSAVMADEEFFWRLHFLLGSLVFTLSNHETLSRLNAEAGAAAPDIERTLHRMIPVLSAGLNARAESNAWCRV